MNQDWTLQGLFEGQHEPSGGGLELYQTFRSKSDRKAIREYTKNYIIREGRHLFESMVEILEKDLASMNDIDRRIEFIKDFKKIAAWRRGDLRRHQFFGFTNSPFGPNTYWKILGSCDYPAEFILDSMKCNAVKVKEASVSVNNKIKKSKSNKSYNLLKGDAKELYKILLDMELLDLSTSEKQFINAFNFKKYSFPKIKWSLSDRLLAYFIEELYCNSFISIDTNKWAIAEIIFEGVNNKGLSTSRAHYLISKTQKPRHYQVVDEAIQSFMSTLSNPK